MWTRLRRRIPRTKSARGFDRERPEAEDWSPFWRRAWWVGLGLVAVAAVLAVSGLPGRWRRAVVGSPAVGYPYAPTQAMVEVSVQAASPDDGLGRWVVRFVGTGDQGVAVTRLAYGNGRFKTRSYLPPGVYRVTLDPPHEYADVRRELRVAAGQPVHLDVDLRAPTVIVGRVVGPGGEPAAGATVRRLPPAGVDVGPVEVTADGRGRYRFARTGAEQPAILEAVHGEHGVRVAGVELDPGRVTRVDLEVAPARAVRGRLSEPFGDATPSVRARSPETGRLEHARVQQDGGFEYQTFGTVPAGLMATATEPDGEVRVVWIPVPSTAGPVQLGEVSADEGGVVWRDDGSGRLQPGQVLTVGLRPEGSQATFDVPVRVDEDRTIRLRGVPPGRVFLRLAAPQEDWDDRAGLVEVFRHDGGLAERTLEGTR